MAVGMRFYSAQRERSLIAERSDSLLAVADLKVDQLAHWRRERLGDAGLVAAASDLSHILDRYLSNPKDLTDEDESIVRERLRGIKQAGDYDNVVFCDSRGDARISVVPVSLPRPVCGELVKEAERRRTVFATDFLKDSDGTLRLVFGCPILSLKSAVIGAILLVADPKDYLFPLIETWPGRSHTAETLLVRKEGNSVLFLNRLRHRQNAALEFSLPLSKSQVLAVQAVNGLEGVLSGLDYRGIEVIGAAHRVPDTPWYLIAKMDRAEALAPLRGAEWTALLVLSLLVVAAGSIVVLLWRQQQLRDYRRQYEAEVRQREMASRFEYLTRYANDIILLFDGAGNVVEANEQAISAYGYTREELLRLKINDLHAPSTFSELPEVNQDRSLTCETKHRRRDGSIFPVEVSSGMVEFKGKRWVQSIIRDVTERKRAEADLKRANRSLRMLTACNEALIRDVNEHDLLGEICRIAVEIGGYRLAWVGFANRDESKTVRLAAKAGTDDDFLETGGITWADEPAGQTPMGMAIRTGRLSLVRGTEGVEQPSFRRYAEDLGIAAGVGLPLTVEGDIIGALAVYSAEVESFDPEEVKVLNELADDLSFGVQTIRGRERQRQSEEALRQSEEQLRQWQKMESIGRLAGSLAHDFNNYLTVIDGYCDFLIADLNQDDPMRGPLEEIRKSGDKVAQLTGQLLAFSRRQAPDFKPISLTEILEDSRNILGRLVGKDVELVFDLAPDLWQVRTDSGQMQQVLMNLATNARDAMPSGGKLVIRANNYHRDRETPTEPGMKPGDYVLLSMEDTGVGMDEETMHHIFEPFFTTKPPGKGTGFGLSTVYGIVRQSSGWILAKSQVGKGTTFQIHLPRANGQYKKVGLAS